jgi:hypothetical protein
MNTLLVLDEASGQATLCPVTIAAALAVIPDTLLARDE